MRMKMNKEYEVGNIQTDRQNELAKEASCSCHCPEFQSSTTRYAHSSTLGKVKRNKEQIVTVLNFNLQASNWIPNSSTMHKLNIQSIFYRPTRQTQRCTTYTYNAKANEPLKLNCYPSMRIHFCNILLHPYIMLHHYVTLQMSNVVTL